MRFKQVFKEGIYIGYIFNIFGGVMGIGGCIAIIFINLCENMYFLFYFFYLDLLTNFFWKVLKIIT